MMINPTSAEIYDQLAALQPGESLWIADAWNIRPPNIPDARLKDYRFKVTPERHEDSGAGRRMMRVA